MSDAQERILEMVAAGKVSAEEGDQLLRSMGPPRRPRWTRFLNPFEELSTAVGLAGGAAVGVGSVLLSRAGVRFDGPLGMHVVAATPTWGQVGLDLALAWPLVAALMWASARVVGAEGRLLDFVSIAGVSRLPLLLSGAVARVLISDPDVSVQRAMQGQVEPTLILVAMLALPALAWSLTWLFVGYRTASGAKGARCALSFIGVIGLAEIVSRIVSWAIPGSWS